MNTSSFIQTRICDDDREIESVYYSGEDAGGWSTVQKGHLCEKIIAYNEPGPNGPMPFYAVYRNGEVYCRIPAYMVYVYYKEAGK
jgi:hypothetical protein